MNTHPAATWAASQQFTPEQIDCTTAVMLKILDGKCKMSSSAKQAAVAIYQEIHAREGEKLGDAIHQAIALAERVPSPELSEEIHRLRIYAEAAIPKSTMKRYKAMLAEALKNLLQ